MVVTTDFHESVFGVLLPFSKFSFKILTVDEHSCCMGKNKKNKDWFFLHFCFN